MLSVARNDTSTAKWIIIRQTPEKRADIIDLLLEQDDLEEFDAERLERRYANFKEG